MIKYSTSILLITLTNALLMNANAGDLQHQAHASIIKTVDYYLEKNLQKSKGIEIVTEISPLDPRLKLTACKSPLQAFTSSNLNQSSIFSIGVKCAGKKPWSLYVSVKVKRIASLFAATIPISRGEVFNESNINKVKRDISKLRQGFYQNKSDLIGMIAKRSIRAGTVLSSKHLTPPMLIKKGDNVDIVAQSSALAIRMSGKALSDGAKGQKIRVKNNSSKRVINAIVMTATKVQVSL